MNFDALLDKAIPLIIPAILVASWMVGHKTGGAGKPKNDGSVGRSNTDNETKEGD